MANIYHDSDVKELQPNDFINKNGKLYLNNQDLKGKPILVKFYAPWCPHCTNLKPVLEKLSQDFKKIGFKVGAVNCDKHSIDNLVKINGYPTIFFGKRSTGHLIEYHDSRDFNSLSNFILQHYQNGLEGIINTVIFNKKKIKRHNFIVTVQGRKDNLFFELNGQKIQDQSINIKLGEQLYLDQSDTSNSKKGNFDIDHPILIDSESDNLDYLIDGRKMDYKDFKKNYNNSLYSRVIIFTPKEKKVFKLKCGNHGEKMGGEVKVD